MPQALAPSVRFFMYEGMDLDQSWLRHCPGFDDMQRSAYNERLGEVYLRDALVQHPWRTRSPEQAKVFFVPLWEVRARELCRTLVCTHVCTRHVRRCVPAQIVSFNVGGCNGTSHRQRMQRAATALRNSPHFAPRGRQGIAGHNHVIASTGCIEKGERLWERLTQPLARLLTASIVGRDRAYSPFYHSSAVGRCTVELPYVSNPHGREYRRLAHTGSANSATSGRRHWLLSFMGSLEVCCEPGRSIRKAMRQLVDHSPNETQVLHIGRAGGRPLAGGSPAEQRERYRASGAQLAASRFCLVPAGDNEVRSREIACYEGCHLRPRPPQVDARCGACPLLICACICPGELPPVLVDGSGVRARRRRQSTIGRLCSARALPPLLAARRAAHVHFRPARSAWPPARHKRR